MENNMTTQEQNKIFAKNLNIQISRTGKTQKEIAKDLGISVTTMNNWCTGVASPKVGKIQILADYFGVSKYELTDDMQEVSMQTYEDIDLLKLYHMLTPSYRKFIRETINSLLNAYDNDK